MIREHKKELVKPSKIRSMQASSDYEYASCSFFRWFPIDNIVEMNTILSEI